MNTVRIALGDLFSAPVQNMSFISYMQYVNTHGKVTPRSLMDIITILLTVVEEQEKQLISNEQKFKDIEAVLLKLVEKKVGDKKENKNDFTSLEIKGGYEVDGKHVIDEEAKGHICIECGKKAASKAGLASHARSAHKTASASA